MTKQTSPPTPSPINREEFIAIHSYISVKTAIELIERVMNVDMSKSILIFEEMVDKQFEKLGRSVALQDAIKVQQSQYELFLKRNNFHE